ncbi:MAG: hypothetical protein LBC79_06235 [Deltaproteobacteria bacterium]|jgi:hypothetical protein|nr:hypothetical protein [Deltaproteobacteria bacterium]
MSALLVTLAGLSMLMGVVSLVQPRFHVFFTASTRQGRRNGGARFWFSLSVVFWGAFRLFYDAGIHALELAAMFALAVYTSGFCRQSLFLPALRKKKSLYAYGVIGFASGFVLRPFLQGNLDAIAHEYKWKLIVILLPAFFLALLYDVFNHKMSGFLGGLLGVALYDSWKNVVSDAFGQLLGALGNTVLILAGMLVSIVFASALFDRLAPYQLLPPLLMLYCCLMMSDIILRIIGGERKA